MGGMDRVTRRSFLGRLGGVIGASAVIAPVSLLKEARATEQGEGDKGAPEVSPPEDLMREHGVLSRILLIYEEMMARMKMGRVFPVELLSDSAGIIRRFIEDYHEKLEEDYLFPRFERTGKLVDLVRTLREQHQAGRRLTEYIRGHALSATMKKSQDREHLAKQMQLFVRMYRPHKAREDTVLFPAFHEIVAPEEFMRLGDEFEDREHKLFGENGFEGIVADVAKLERALNLYELAQFTPRL